LAGGRRDGAGQEARGRKHLTEQEGDGEDAWAGYPVEEKMRRAARGRRNPATGRYQTGYPVEEKMRRAALIGILVALLIGGGGYAWSRMHARHYG
jgi:hypothetical protein